jgi:hypothetical protein
MFTDWLSWKSRMLAYCSRTCAASGMRVSRGISMRSPVLTPAGGLPDVTAGIEPELLDGSPTGPTAGTVPVLLDDGPTGGAAGIEPVILLPLSSGMESGLLA